jgi:diadenosine tetraphosphate (Ap4A) HIT family hydrolase
MTASTFKRYLKVILMVSYVTGAFSFLSGCFSLSETQPAESTKVYQGDTIDVSSPQKVLTPGNLELTTKNQKPSLQIWTDREIQESHALLKAIASVWHEKGKIGNFMVFGKEDVVLQKPFIWNFLPYQETSGTIARFWQQFKVIWRIYFGGISEYAELREKNITLFQLEIPHELRQQIAAVEEVVKGKDSFCKDGVIENQWVLKGKKINVLYNYAPVGLGGEKIHFLFVPVRHCKTFRELTAEEYLEALKLTQLVLQHFKQTRNVHAVYMYHKTGKDAGQTEDHWHMHFIIATSSHQDWLGKLSVVKKTAIGSTPLKGPDLQKPVEKYRAELKHLTLH